MAALFADRVEAGDSLADALLAEAGATASVACRVARDLGAADVVALLAARA
jgi:predicted phosphoribosyltransferase